MQRQNLIELAQHLIRCATLLRHGALLVFSAHESERAPLPPDAVIEGRRMPPMMPLAHGPLAGVPARTGETWSDYGERAFLMSLGSPLEQWLQRPHWRMTDPTPIGVALRIMHALDYGVPGNWERISYGADQSNYPYDGHAWQRLDLAGWKEGEGLAEWDIEWQQMRTVTLYRGGRG